MSVKVPDVGPAQPDRNFTTSLSTAGQFPELGRPDGNFDGMSPRAQMKGSLAVWMESPFSVAGMIKHQ